MTWDGADRRAHRRYGVKGSIIRWRPGPPIGWFSPVSSPYVLLDLSSTGCHFVSERELPPGKSISLLIAAPHSPIPARCWGRVSWSRRSEEHEAWHTGVTMRARSAASVARLKHILDGAVLDKIEITTRRYLKEMGRL